MKQFLITPRIIWAALFGSVLVYLGLLDVVPPQHDTWEKLLIPLALVAVTLTALTLVLPRRMYRSSIERLSLEVIDGEFSNPDAVLQKVKGVYMTPFILGIALSESIAIYGLILGFMGASVPYVIPFFAVCWILLLAQFPTRDRVMGPVEQAYDAKWIEPG